MTTKRYTTTRTTTDKDGTTHTVQTTRSQGTIARFLGWCFILALAASGVIWLVHHL